MRVVLTGATGFVGGALLKRLLDDGYQVLALGRNIETMRESLPASEEVGHFDLANPAPPDGLSEGDVLIHCAALLGNAKADRKEYLRANTQSTLVLAKAAREARCALFQFYSSVSANGPIASKDNPLHESSPFRPASLYGLSKALAEKALAKVQDLPIQILRPPVIYGPGANRSSSASKVFRLMKGKAFLRSGGGSNYFNVIALGNLVDASVHLMRQALEGNLDKQKIASSDHLPPCPSTWMLRDDPCPTMAQVQDWIAEVYEHTPVYLHLPYVVLLPLGWLGDGLRAIGLHFPLTAETAKGSATSAYYSSMNPLLETGWAPPQSPQEAIRETARTFSLSREQ